MATSELDNDPKKPMARVQRKHFESSTTSLNHSLNASLHLNFTSNESILNVTNVPYGSVSNISTTGSRTPATTPTRLNTSRTTPGGQNQKKTPRTPSHGGDRFIPNRNAMNIEISHFLVTQNGTKENGIVENKISEAMNVDLNNYRIMNCHDRANEAPNGLRVLYSSGKQLATVKKQAPRSIPAQPERILDAPDILNDYYLQLVDWSSRNILAVALNRELYLWNAMTGDIDNLFQCSENEYIASVAWVHSSDRLAIGMSNGDIQVWDAGTRKKIRTMRGHAERVASLSWNSHTLSSGCRDGKIFHHDVRQSAHHIGSMNVHTQEVCGLKWSPNGVYLASGGNDNIVCIWGNNINDGANVSPLQKICDNTSAVKALAWCPYKGNVLATGAGAVDKRIRIWNVNNGINLDSVDTGSQVCGLLWSNDHQEIMSAHGYPNNELMLWKHNERAPLSKVTDLNGHTARVLDIVMCPDGTTVVSVGADETLRFWECFQVDAEKKKKAEVKAYKEQLGNNGLRMGIR